MMMNGSADPKPLNQAASGRRTCPALCSFAGLPKRKFMVTSLIGLLFASCVHSLPAQQLAPRFARPAIGTTVQLPEVRFFQLNTTVSVPDGGSLFLGGVSSAASGQQTSGFWPRTRSAGTSLAGGGVSVHATNLSQREIDDFLTAEGERLSALRAARDPNGPVEVQRQADFLSRHVGRD